MYFHEKTGWGIALRIILVLVLIAGVAWIVRTAYFQGVAVGAQRMGPGMMDYSEEGSWMESHYQRGFQEYGRPGGMIFQHAGGMMPYGGYAGAAGYHSLGSFGAGFFHLLFGFLGFFLLLKLIFGFGGLGMYRYGPLGWGPGGRPYHGWHHRHHRCGCPYCSGEEGEGDMPEKTPEAKPKKKAA